MDYLKRIWEYAETEKKWIKLAILLSSIGVLCGIMPYIFASSIINNLIQGNHDTKYYMLLCLFIFLGYSLKSILYGILDNYLSADNMSDEVWNKVFDVNLTGPMRLTREVLKYMEKQKHGNIINTSSVGGLYGGRGGLAYVASKHALIGMTKHIGFMFQDKGIRCNAIAPGSIGTEIGLKVTNPNMSVLNKLMKHFELFPQTGEANEIANIMLFLASEESSFINGTTIVADGGWTAF